MRDLNLVAFISVDLKIYNHRIYQKASKDGPPTHQVNSQRQYIFEKFTWKWSQTSYVQFSSVKHFIIILFV